MPKGQGGTLLINVTHLFTLNSIFLLLLISRLIPPPTDSNVLFTLPLGRYLRLKMFREDHGSWMTMFFSTILFLFIFSHIYNLFLLMAGNMK